ncbi:MAG: ABC transporter permease [Actinobacteria bacterium]|nr:ABC transporter permease [Actinomycetota bacterium]
MTAASRAAAPDWGRGRRRSGGRIVRGVVADRNGAVGALLLAAILALALAAVTGLLPHDPLGQQPADRLTGPSPAYWLGTDQFGRDIATRTFVGVAASLRVVVLAVAIAALTGTLAGVTAGFLGGHTDAVVGRAADVLFAFPAILLAMAVVTGLGRGWVNTAIAIAVVYTPIFVRVSRGPTLAVRHAEYVLAGRVLGFSRRRLLLRHVLPNVAAPVVVQVALSLSWAVLTESALSFLGLGTQPPDPSLGLMVADARTLLAPAPWTLLAPAAAIVVVVVGFNLLGDGLRSALDPTVGPR